MLLSRKKVTEDLPVESLQVERVDMIMGWRHSGFNAFCGPRKWGSTLKGWGLSTPRVRRIQPGEEEAIEILAR